MRNEVLRAIHRVCDELGWSTDELTRGIAGRYRGVADTVGRGSARRAAVDEDAGSRMQWVGNARDREQTEMRANPSEVLDQPGLRPTRVTYTRDDFVMLWQSKIKRRMTAEEHAILDRGCVGIVLLHLGESKGMPPLNLSFRDLTAHHALRTAERALTEGEIANAGLRKLRDHQNSDRRHLKSMQDEYQRFLEGDPKARDLSANIESRREWIQHGERILAEAESEARSIWTGFPKGFSREMLNMRLDSHLEGGIRTLDRVSEYVEKLNRILGENPSRRGFARMVERDADLAKLWGIVLPRGAPAGYRAEIICKRFFSGRRLLSYDGTRRLSAAEIEAPLDSRLLPDERSGQVDMSSVDTSRGPHTGDVDFFDYGYYDRDSRTWWYANHAQYHDPKDPMLVYQSTSAEFFTDSLSDFDRSVISIVFRRLVKGAD